MKVARLTSLLLALMVGAYAAPASADVYDDYRDDGQINSCSYSDDQLRNARDGLPPDVLQYSPGLADQLSAGRADCGGGAPGTSADTRQFEAVPGPGTPGEGGGTGAAGAGAGAGSLRQARTIPDPPTPTVAERARLAQITAPAVSATTRSDVPAWVTALLVGGALAAALFATAAAFGRRRGLGLGSLRTSFAEAGGRTADAAAEAFDSIRLGR